MPVQMTIIGLGQIGASIGLALANQKELVVRIGHDREPAIARRAKDIGAVDRTEFNLHAAVEKADIVLLTLPMDQLKETLELIAGDLHEGVVVMDTGPVKEIVAGWTAAALPAGVHYVGLTPVINPAYLHEVDGGISAAHPDLFKNGLMAIVSPPSASSDAIKLAADLTRLLGANPLFFDTAEIDGLMATTHQLPQLLAAALINSSIDQPGWREARKVAGRAYAEVTSPMAQLDSPESLSSSAILNRQNLVRMIDSTIAALQTLRSDIQAENTSALRERLVRARDGRVLWWNQRQKADWLTEELGSKQEMPKASDIFGNLLGFRRKPKK